MLYRTIATPGLLAEFEKEHAPLTPNSEHDEGRAKAAAFLIRSRKPDCCCSIYLTSTTRSTPMGRGAGIVRGAHGTTVGFGDRPPIGAPHQRR